MRCIKVNGCLPAAFICKMNMGITYNVTGKIRNGGNVCDATGEGTSEIQRVIGRAVVGLPVR